MNKFRRLQITLATVLCLIGGNEVSSSKVNADTPKSAQVSQHGFGVTFTVFFILTSIFVKRMGNKKYEQIILKEF